MYENTEPWDKSVPADLLPAVKHLRKSFDDAHWKCGRITEIFCFSLLHKIVANEELKDYVKPFLQLKAMVGAAATRRFEDMFVQGTPATIFKCFYDLYLEGMNVQALRIFRDLVEIGCANEKRLGIPHMEWAEAQVTHLISSHTHSIKIWVRSVCDKQVNDPNEKNPEEWIFWRKWQAPMFLVMKPSLYQPYEAVMAWERREAESSSQLLEHFAEHYVLHLEIKVKKAAGEATLELAKKPQPIGSTPTEGDATKQNLPNPAAVVRQHTGEPTPDNDRYTPNNARREVRKLNTRGMHDIWRKEYRKLKKSHPDMSDVWYSKKIARMAIACGRSAETVRKHMTK
jgi:hypothetical protein